MDFEQLALEKSLISTSKSRHPKVITLGSEQFLLASHGTGSGYPFLLENDAFSIQCGEFNKPNFYVAFRSFALWHIGASALHQRFLAWAASVGLMPYRPEKLSRVDMTFDYQIDPIDFDEDCFVSQANKDAQHRKDGRVQTFRFGAGDLVLRVYNKCDEIEEKSAKSWFYALWGVEKNVWRIEWQTRKELLKHFGIRTFQDLAERQGDLLRYLVNDHTALRIRTDDSNRSRWPLHPLWVDLQARVNVMEGLGVVRECDPQSLLDERLIRLGVSVYGYMKRLAAIHGLKRGYSEVGLEETIERLRKLLNRVHDPLSWDGDVQRRMDEMRLGQW
ncbi:hypothetical protein [Georgfuchsia toluolica]|uniref:hypothetical protein n=1 Tax=Georgfuchsia toluolica TaxID=424218 RepID=UPI001FE88718|nr:hypothetical protein [Georgfuchsia toluolica]